VYRIRRVVDKMLCILPFEADFYKKFGVEVAYVGNPVLDAIDRHVADERFMSRLATAGKQFVALLPGSRKQEISRLLPEMIGAMKLLPGCTTVIAGAPNFSKEYYDSFTGGSIPVVFGHTYDLLLCADSAVVASGTAVLETALLKTPQAAVYKANALMVVLARKLLKIKYITLPNLIVGREIVKELIQELCTPEKISAELDRLLTNKAYRNVQLADYSELAGIMGRAGASESAAEIIYSELQSGM
jgi:lipid-A-disaccharide synthase